MRVAPCRAPYSRGRFGYCFDQARQEAQKALEEAQTAGYRRTICRIMFNAQCFIAFFDGDEAAERTVATLVDLAESCNSAYWSLLGQCLTGKLLVRVGRFSEDVKLLRAAVRHCEKTGWMICLPEFLCALPEGLHALGKPSEALSTVERGRVRAVSSGEAWYLPEILRIKAELLLREGSEPGLAEAEQCLQQALGIARQQSALLWELRVARSLAWEKIKRKRQHEAREILAPVHARFTEGFDMPDLRRAKTMLGKA